MLLDNGEPSNYEEAMAGPDSDKWLEAMKSEIGSMYENEVWTLTDLPDDRRAIASSYFVGPQGHVPHQSGTATLSWKSCC